MAVPLLLFQTLDYLNRDDFKRFKWWLGNDVLDSCKPIPRSRLEDADRMDTVEVMTKHYGEDMAVNLAVEILKMIYNSDAAEKLKNGYAGVKTSAASTSTSAAAAAAPPAAPPAAATMMAQQDGVIIAPTVAGGTIGTLTINFNKA